MIMLPAQPTPAEPGQAAHPQAVSSASSRPAMTSTRTSSRATTRGISACAWFPTAICSRRSAAGSRVGRHRSDRHVHRDRARLRLRGRARGRPDRHRDRAQSAGAGRHGGRRRRREVDSPETMSYKGMMLSGVPNLAMRLRLHQRLVDAQVRPDLRVRVPAAQPHGRARLPAVHARSREPVDRRGAVHRLLLGLRRAVDPPVPQAGIQGALAAVPELRADIAQPALRHLEDGALQFSSAARHATRAGVAA